MDVLTNPLVAGMDHTVQVFGDTCDRLADVFATAAHRLDWLTDAMAGIALDLRWWAVASRQVP